MPQRGNTPRGYLKNLKYSQIFLHFLQSLSEMQDFIDMRAYYLFIQYVGGNRPAYIFIQYTENEDFCDVLADQILLLNEEYGRGRNVHLFPTPLKGSTVSDFSQDIPTYIVSGRQECCEESYVARLLRSWVRESKKD